MKTLITTLSVLSLSASFAFAQKGKIVRQIIRPQGEIRASSALKDIGPEIDPTLYRYSRRVPSVPAPSVRYDALRRLEHNLHISLTDNSLLIPAYDGKNALLRISLARSSSPAKQILNAEAVFQKWYIPEVKNANKLLTRIANMKKEGTLFTDASAMQELEKTIAETVVNNSLRRYLLRDIAKQDYIALIQDLADYYTLPRNYAAQPDLGHLAVLDAPDAFATSAAGYLVRHPHKINLKWRRLMTHPAVSQQTQEAMQAFINKNSISMTDFEELHALLKDAYVQHATALTALRQAPEIQGSIEVYEEYLTKLKTFIAQNGRLPSWNTADPAEQAFSQELAVLTLSDDHMFGPLKDLAAETRALLARYTPAPVPFEETLPRLQAFCEKHHRLPNAYPANPNVSAEEAELYNQFIYWELNGSLEQRQALGQILSLTR